MALRLVRNTAALLLLSGCGTSPTIPVPDLNFLNGLAKTTQRRAPTAASVLPLINHGSTAPVMPPGVSVPGDLFFLVTDATGQPAANATVVVKLFDVTAAHGWADERLDTAIKARWSAPVPVLHVDGAARPDCVLMGGRASDMQDEEDRHFAAVDVARWLGRLSDVPRTADGNGIVRVAYTTPQTVDCEIAVAVAVAAIDDRPPAALQFVRIRTQTLNEMIAAPHTPIRATVWTVPSPIFAGQAFDLLVEAQLPDTGGETLTLEVTATAPGSGGRLPARTIKCAFRMGQCLAPGGPFEVMAPGALSLSIDDLKGLLAPIDGFRADIVSARPGDAVRGPFDVAKHGEHAALLRAYRSNL